MKRLFLLLLVVGILTSCGASAGALPTETLGEALRLSDSEGAAEAQNVREYVVMVEYAVADIKDVVDASVTVCRATYIGALGCYADTSYTGSPRTRVEFEVTEVYKGTVDSERVVANHAGGTVTEAELYAVRMESYKEMGRDTNTGKFGQPLTPPANGDGLVCMKGTPDPVELEEGKEYLLCLFNDAGSITADYYGVPEIRGDEVYNRIEDCFIPLSSVLDVNES